MTVIWASVEERFWSKVDRRGPDECWPWTAGIGTMGYGSFLLNGRKRNATQVAWELTNGKPFPSGYEACHSCDNRACVNPAHLWVGTHAENMRDMDRKGRARKPPWNGRRRGEGNPRAKLTEANVSEIRRLRGQASQSELAARFGVSTTTISQIHNGKRWSEKP